MLSFPRAVRGLTVAVLTAAAFGVPSVASAHVGFTEPANYTQVQPGQKVVLKWGIEDHGAASFKIEFAEDVGKPWSNVANMQKQGRGPFEYTWTVPNVSCTNCRLRITMTAAGSGQTWDGTRQLSIGSAGTPRPSTGEPTSQAPSGGATGQAAAGGGTAQPASGGSEDGGDGGGCALGGHGAPWHATALTALALATVLRRRGRR